MYIAITHFQYLVLLELRFTHPRLINPIQTNQTSLSLTYDIGHLKSYAQHIFD